MIPGYVWYPTIEGTRWHATIPDTGGSRGPGSGDGAKLRLRNNGARWAEFGDGAQCRRRAARAGDIISVLIFNHGYECYPAQNTALLEQLTSHGYIVFSIAHPYDAADLRVLLGGTSFGLLRAERAILCLLPFKER